MRNDSRLSHADVIDPEISDDEAKWLSTAVCQSKLSVFISVLGTAHPISPDKAAALLKHIVRDRIEADPNLIAGQIRLDHWDDELANGDNPDVLAERACAFFGTREGDALLRFFSDLFVPGDERVT